MAGTTYLNTNNPDYFPSSHHFASVYDPDSGLLATRNATRPVTASTSQSASRRATPCGDKQSNVGSLKQRGQSAPSFGAQRGRGFRPGITPAITSYRWLLGQAPVAYDTLDSIRNRAREMWQSGEVIERCQNTSYSGHFPEKVLDERTQSRPTSPTRVNNPHPSLVFLTCRLHHVPGFNNPDTTLGKSPYRVDASVNADEQILRNHIRGSYRARPSTASLAQYRPDATSDNYPVNVPAAVEEPTSVYDLMKGLSSTNEESPLNEYRHDLDNLENMNASLHRHLKTQGPIEKERLKFNSAAVQRPKTACASLVQSSGDLANLFPTTSSTTDYSKLHRSGSAASFKSSSSMRSGASINRRPKTAAPAFVKRFDSQTSPINNTTYTTTNNNYGYHTGAYYSGLVNGDVNNVVTSRPPKSGGSSSQKSSLVYHSRASQQRNNYAIHYQWPNTLKHHRE